MSNTTSIFKIPFQRNAMYYFMFIEGSTRPTSYTLNLNIAVCSLGPVYMNT